MEFHEVTNLFPLMNNEEYAALVIDIRQHGLRNPIWTYAGKIIDGRNRYRACQEAQVLPSFREYQGDTSPEALTRFVLSLNLHRRHLTSSQKAVSALKIVTFLAQVAKQRQGKRTDRQQNFPQDFEESWGEAAEQAAAIVGTNRQYVYDAKHLAKHAPDLLDAVHQGLLTLPETKVVTPLPQSERSSILALVQRGDIASVKPFLHQATTTPETNVHHLLSSACNEWYTPKPYIEAVREVLGEIDLDPASTAIANEIVCARHYYTCNDDGYLKAWPGRVFLNPPYGIEHGESNQARWSRRLIEQYHTGVTSEAVLLVNAVPSNSWFAPLWEFPICFTDHRIHFYNVTAEAAQPTHSNAFVYLGPQIARFVRIFSRFGVVATRLTPE